MKLFFCNPEGFPDTYVYGELQILSPHVRATSMADGLLTVMISVEKQRSLQKSRYMSLISPIQLHILS